MGRVTLLDLARHCGVSRSTVSLVLNDSPLVASDTRQRVQAAMDELGYVRNRMAASLRRQRSDALGVVLTQITNPYFAEFAAGLQEEMSGSGTGVPLLAVSNEDKGLQRRLVSSLVELNVDGIVLVPAHGTTAADLPNLLGTPLVLLARKVPDLAVDYVGARNHEGGYAAADHLWGHGCRRIAFVGGFKDSSARQERLGGVRAFLAERHKRLSVAFSPESEASRRAGRAACELLLANHEVDGIVCFNDIVAAGVMDAVAAAGLSIGDDVRIIGFDDLRDAVVSRPSLSSVAVPARESGRRAAEIVIARAAGQDGPRMTEEFPTKLRPRETCGCDDLEA